MCCLQVKQTPYMFTALKTTIIPDPNFVTVFCVRLSQNFINIVFLILNTCSFCGGDFLYDFPKDFQRNKVLIFTAGLLLRLLKLGVYSLTEASLVVLHDAFAAVRNHPMNTLIREYYFKGPAAQEETAAEVSLPRVSSSRYLEKHVC